MSVDADVISGIPHGIVLGPLLFLNDLPESISSDTILFADDALIYRHTRRLQQDIYALQDWERKWQMNFHPEKCQVVRIYTSKRFQRKTTYTIQGHIF